MPQPEGIISTSTGPVASVVEVEEVIEEEVDETQA